MNKLIVLSICLLLIIGCSPQGDNSNPSETSNSTPQENVQKIPVEWGNTHCPVMEDPVDVEEGGSYVYEGKLVRFCCPKCIKKFKGDTEKYSKVLAKYLPKNGEQAPPSKDKSEHDHSKHDHSGH